MKITPTTTPLGSYLRQQRIDFLGLSIRDAFGRLNLSDRTITMLERGAIEITPRTIRHYQDAGIYIPSILLPPNLRHLAADFLGDLSNSPDQRESVKGMLPIFCDPLQRRSPGNRTLHSDGWHPHTACASARHCYKDPCPFRPRGTPSAFYPVQTITLMPATSVKQREIL